MWQNGNNRYNFRLFYNSVLAFALIYIDIIWVVKQTVTSYDSVTKTYVNFEQVESGGYGLIVLGIYGTISLSIRLILAISYHLKWMLTESCCLKL